MREWQGTRFEKKVKKVKRTEREREILAQAFLDLIGLVGQRISDKTEKREGRMKYGKNNKTIENRL